MPKISLPANQSEIHNGVEFIEQTIRKYRFKNKEVMKTLLIAEESMVRLIGKTESDVQMQISIRYQYGVAEITISAAGEPLAADEPQIDLTVGDMGHDSEETIRTILLQAFSDTNAMQLLFIAFLGGIVLGGTGRYTRELRTAADALDSFFSATAGIVSNAIPVMTFFSTILCVAYFDFTSLNIGLEVFGVTVLGLAMMLAGYMMLVFASRLNPITFLRKYAPNVVSIFLGGSSIHAIPETMRVCEKKFGVSPKVFSFSIPFGAIGNLDGNCVYLTIAGLYMARLYGVSFLGRELISIIFAVVLLSVGAPIVPGTVMVTLTMLMNTMGMSPVGMSFIIGINVIIEMLLTACNTIGDVAITLVVARTEGLIDLDVYRRKSTEKTAK